MLMFKSLGSRLLNGRINLDLTRKFPKNPLTKEWSLLPIPKLRSQLSDPCSYFCAPVDVSLKRCLSFSNRLLIHHSFTWRESSMCVWIAVSFSLSAFIIYECFYYFKREVNHLETLVEIFVVIWENVCFRNVRK